MSSIILKTGNVSDIGNYVDAAKWIARRGRWEEARKTLNNKTVTTFPFIYVIIRSSTPANGVSKTTRCHSMTWHNSAILILSTLTIRRILPGIPHLSTHPLWLTIPLVKDPLLLLQLDTQHVSLMPVPVICTLGFWVQHTQLWHSYEMEQRWHTTTPTMV